MTAYALLQTLLEGGWATTATQQTQIRPSTVKLALSQLQDHVKSFNNWLAQQDSNLRVDLGPPTGSGHYYQQDPESKEYGDIDLQMVAPNPWQHSHSTYSSEWNHMWDEWVARDQPKGIQPEASTPGHPILELPTGELVQVDFMWHEPNKAEWGLARSVPPRGVKGLLNGNLFSVLGSMLMMSMQHSGVQIKLSNGVPVPFSKQKGVIIHTITHNPRRMFLDLLTYLADKPLEDLQLNADLKANPGVKWPNPDINVMVRGIHGLAQALQDNLLFGKGVLKDYTNAQDFLTKFWHSYEAKAVAEINNPKRLKAETPSAQARADRDRASIQQGLDKVQKLWFG
jgi:hypothetical protein